MSWAHGVKKVMAMSPVLPRDTSSTTTEIACIRLQSETAALTWLKGAAASRWGALAELAEYAVTVGRGMYGADDGIAAAALQGASAEAEAMRVREQALRNALGPADGELAELKQRISTLESLRRARGTALSDDAYYREKGAKLAGVVSPVQGAHADRAVRTARKQVASAENAEALASRMQSELAVALRLRQVAADRILSAVCMAISDCSHIPAAAWNARMLAERQAQASTDDLPSVAENAGNTTGHPGAGLGSLAGTGQSIPPTPSGPTSAVPNIARAARQTLSRRGQELAHGARSFMQGRRSREGLEVVASGVPETQQQTSDRHPQFRQVPPTDPTMGTQHSAPSTLPHQPDMSCSSQQHRANSATGNISERAAMHGREGSDETDEAIWDQKLHLEILEANIPDVIMQSGSGNPRPALESHQLPQNIASNSVNGEQTNQDAGLETSQNHIDDQGGFPADEHRRPALGGVSYPAVGMLEVKSAPVPSAPSFEDTEPPSLSEFSYPTFNRETQGQVLNSAAEDAGAEGPSEQRLYPNNAT